MRTIDKKLLSKECSYCKKKFFKTTSESILTWHTRTKYCSQPCQINHMQILNKTNGWIERTSKRMKQPRSKQSNEKRRKTLIEKYKDPVFYTYRLEVMKKARHPKHPGHGPKISATRKRLFKAGILSTKMEKNPAWKGGKSFEPYPLGWTKTFKEQIRFRDGYKCRLCGMSEVENNAKLCVHHIDYNKNNLSLKNLISLCRSCHGKTESRREHWIKYFSNINK